jgi:hypothetical protein
MPIVEKYLRKKANQGRMEAKAFASRFPVSESAAKIRDLIDRLNADFDTKNYKRAKSLGPSKYPEQERVERWLRWHHFFVTGPDSDFRISYGKEPEEFAAMPTPGRLALNIGYWTSRVAIRPNSTGQGATITFRLEKIFYKGGTGEMGARGEFDFLMKALDNAFA